MRCCVTCPSPVFLLAIVSLSFFVISSKAQINVPKADDISKLTQSFGAIIDQYLADEYYRLQKIKKTLNLVVNATKHFMNDDSDLQHLLTAFRAIRTMNDQWTKTVKLMTTNAAHKYMDHIAYQDRNTEEWYPIFNDQMDAAVSALFRVQDIYHIPTATLVRGEAHNTRVNVQLSGMDSFIIGRQSYDNGDYYHSLLWMQQALEQRKLPATKSELPKEEEILGYLGFSNYKQGNLERATVLTKRLLEIDPENEDALSNMRFFENALAAKNRSVDYVTSAALPPLVNPRPPDKFASVFDSQYEALCQGKKLLTAAEEAKLYCYYRNDHPYLKLAPFKVDVLSPHPFVAVFRDVITNREAEAIMQLAAAKLEVAQVRRQMNEDALNPFVSKVRTAQSAWLDAQKHEAIELVDRRTQLMTGLTIKTGEALQVGMYGIGGHYSPHFDFARNPPDPVEVYEGLPWGNRIATVLFYLKEPSSGGATAFPRLKLALQPTKNDAAFWYNLHKNGSGIWETMHAGCPVITGEKWVANKWIHEFEQERLYPCGLNQNE